ncbi:MAG: hypothetical protein DHS20C19_11240 [Acidimicrobiales bacterium]|nr:MAG: hypothetical protein DHS20C19_11240 [Acidimicrobiales bacterium]
MPLVLAVEDPSVAGARGGDALAWADLYERFQPVLLRYLEVVAPDELNDMDAVWRRAGRALAGQPEGVDPLVWLLRVARDGRVLCPSPEDTDDPTIKRIRSLRPLDMDVIALRVIAGLSDEDVAVVTGRPIERIRMAGHRGVAKLVDEGAA